MHLFLSAGEPSGDLHGANLIQALKRREPNLRLVGFGGERMQQAGCRLLYPLCRLAVMWFFKTLWYLPFFLRLLRQSRQYFQDERPDALVVIDFPGFHFQLIRRAKRIGIPVYYFVPPQLWAWNPGRVAKVRRDVDRVFCTLPFEPAWYAARGVDAEFVGHPYFDETSQRQLDATFLAGQGESAGPIIGLLPGSRRQEVKTNLPMILKAAEKIHAQRPDTRFFIAAFNDEQAGIAREMCATINLPVVIHIGKTPEVIELAHLCISVSGSVSLELLYHLKPAIIVYKVGPIGLRMARLLKRCRYITLVNLLADAEIYPEFLTDHDQSTPIAVQAVRWLERPEEREGVIDQLKQLRAEVCQPGACDRAAEGILESLRGDRTSAVRAA